MRRSGAVERAFDGILAELKLDKAAHMRARYLSAGQRRRVALAMLRLSGAKLWLLDEPTTNLDSEGRALLVDVDAPSRCRRRARHGRDASARRVRDPRRIDDRVVMNAFNAVFVRDLRVAFRRWSELGIR